MYDHLVPGQDVSKIRDGNATVTSVMVEKQKLVKTDPKGKGKAHKNDLWMADITNSESY